MKFLTLFLISLLLISCNTELETPDLATVEEAKNGQSVSFVKSAMKVDFKQDFRINKLSEQVAPIARPSATEIKFIHKASNPDPTILYQNYPAAKEQLIQWNLENNNNQYSWAIQAVALKYLRNLFLTKNTVEATEETKFLMECLVENEAIDLDVLADGYHKIADQLSANKKESYLNHIQNVYKKDISFIRDKAVQFERAYKNADIGSEERYKYLSWGKDLERRSQSCRYTRELLSYSGISD